MRSSAIFWFWLACFQIASSQSSEMHKFVDAHFRNHCYGIDLYFCKFEDAVANSRYARRRAVFTRRVKALKTMEEFDDPSEPHTFIHRASVFLDASCDEGLQLLNRSVLKMNLNFRWLIFTEDVLSVYRILEMSRLEMDSDVTLIRKLNDSTFEFSRLTRIYFKSHFSLSANYSLQETTGNEKLNQALLWRGEEIGFGNYRFDALVLFLESKYYKLEDWPLLLNKSKEPGVENIRKFFAQPLWYLMEMYNFTLNITNVKDWGALLPNGSFTGALGMIERRELEFGLTGVRPESYRIGSMDFSVSLINSRFTFILTQPKTFGTAAALIVPFQTATWWGLLFLVIILTVVMRISILCDKEQLHNDSWGGSILLVIGGISQNGIPDSPTKLSSRTIHLVTLLSLFLIFLYYSTSVLNGLILPSPDPIQNIYQLIASNTELGGQDVLYIRRELSMNDPLTKQARKKLIPQPFLSTEEGIRRVRKGHFAFYGLDRILRSAAKAQFSENERCLITEIPMIREFQLCFFWRKKSPFTEIMNRGLLRMKERGIIDYLKKYWLVQKPKCTGSLFFAPIKLQGMTLAYVVLAIGLVFCLIIAILELFVARIMRNHSPKLPFLS